MSGNDKYHGAVTQFPDGRVYSGEHEKGVPLNGKFLGKLIKSKSTGLVAKTATNQKLAALSAAIMGNPEMSLNAASSIANADNLTHLQLIRLLPEAQGIPDEYFYLENMFVSRDVPQLEYRETFYDTTATAKYKRRLEESKATKTVYDEIKYDLLKLSDKVFTPIEDIFRTIINPQTVDMGQIRWGFQFKRNQSALKALKKIGNAVSALPKFSTIGATDFHHTNKAADLLNNEFNIFLKANDVKITHVAMNAKLLQDYSENTWTLSGPTDLNPIRLAGGGVIPLPGIAGVTAIIDVTIPDDTIYAVNKPNALRLGEGPKIMRRYYDEERDAEAIKILDFHEHIAVNSQLTKITRKFGMTIPVTP